MGGAGFRQRRAAGSMTTAPVQDTRAHLSHLLRNGLLLFVLTQPTPFPTCFPHLCGGLAGLLGHLLNNGLLLQVVGHKEVLAAERGVGHCLHTLSGATQYQSSTSGIVD